MGRRKQTEPPVPAAYLQECFAVADEGRLIWRTRGPEHFPERPEDVANFNARFAGRPAGFRIGAETFIRIQWRGRTRRISALRAAFIVANGRYPVGVVEPLDGNAANVRPGNLVERSLVRSRHGGTSLAQRRAANAALLAAMRDHPNATVGEIAEIVGLDQPCTSRRLAKFAKQGVTASPMCVPGRAWCITGQGLALSAKPLVDDLDREILSALRWRDHIVAASIVRRVPEAHEMTIRRRLRSVSADLLGAPSVLRARVVTTIAQNGPARNILRHSRSADPHARARPASPVETSGSNCRAASVPWWLTICDHYALSRSAQRTQWNGQLHRRDRVNQPKPGADGPLSIVLVGLRIAEIDKRSIAHKLGDRAAKAGHSGDAGFLKSAEDVAHFLGIEPGRKRGRTDEVAEHDGQLSAFSIGRSWGAADAGPGPG